MTSLTKRFFFPVMLLSGLLFLAQILVKDISDVLSLKIFHELPSNPAQAGSAFPMFIIFGSVLSIVFSVILLIAARKCSFKKVIFWSLGTLTALGMGLGFLLPFQDSLAFLGAYNWLTGYMSEGSAVVYAPFLKHWIPLLFSFFSSLLTGALISAVLWGFINEAAQIKKNVKDYLLLAMALGIGYAIANLSMGMLLMASTAKGVLGLAGLSIGALWWIGLCAFVLGQVALYGFLGPIDQLKKAKPAQASDSVSSYKFPMKNSLIMLGAVLVALSIFDTVFKIQMRQGASPASYAKSMGLFMVALNYSKALAQLALLGTGLYMLNKKGGLRILMTAASISLSVTTVLYIASGYVFTSSSALTRFVIYKGTVHSILFIVLLPVVQSFIGSLVEKRRLFTQFLMGFAIMWLPIWIAAPIKQLVLASFGSSSQVQMPLMTIATGFIFIASWTCFSLGKSESKELQVGS